MAAHLGGEGGGAETCILLACVCSNPLLQIKNIDTGAFEKLVAGQPPWSAQILNSVARSC